MNPTDNSNVPSTPNASIPPAQTPPESIQPTPSSPLPSPPTSQDPQTLQTPQAPQSPSNHKKIIIIVVTVILVLTLAGGAYMFLKNRSADNNEANRTDTTTTEEQKTEDKPKAEVDPKQNAIYFKEWSISINYNGRTADLLYAFKDGQPNSAYITSNALSKTFPATCNFKPDPETASIGHFNRGLPEETISTGASTFQEALTNNPTRSATIGKYIYTFIPAVKPCTDEPTKGKPFIEEALKAVDTLF